MKKDEIKKLLKNFGIGVTKARVEILNIFLNKCSEISAEYIFEKLSFDFATIYRKFR